MHKNWQTGVEKTSIGHHINDRAHIIQKVKNNNTGNEEVKQTFVNLNEGKIKIPMSDIHSICVFKDHTMCWRHKNKYIPRKVIACNRFLVILS